METYDTSHSLFLVKDDSKKIKKSIHPYAGSQKDVFDPVMPLHQIILFANQAAFKKNIVSITIEQEINKKAFKRSTLKGVFRSGVNRNRQITFESEDKKLIHLLSIESILSIQLIL